MSGMTDVVEHMMKNQPMHAKSLWCIGAWCTDEHHIRCPYCKSFVSDTSLDHFGGTEARRILEDKVPNVSAGRPLLCTDCFGIIGQIVEPCDTPYVCLWVDESDGRCGMDVYTDDPGIRVQLCQKHYACMVKEVSGDLKDDNRALRNSLEGGTPKGGPIVYYLKASNGLVKIGTTTDFPSRRKSLEKDHGALSLEGWEPGYMLLEKERHKQFRRLREFGEWFRSDPELQRFLHRLRENEGIAA